jgi:hypothetical protein
MEGVRISLHIISFIYSRQIVRLMLKVEAGTGPKCLSKLKVVYKRLPTHFQS